MQAGMAVPCDPRVLGAGSRPVVREVRRTQHPFITLGLGGGEAERAGARRTGLKRGSSAGGSGTTEQKLNSRYAGAAARLSALAPRRAARRPAR
jgi:hypothetical protein